MCAQSCLTLWDSMDCSPPGSLAHGIFQAKVLEWGVIPFFRVSSWPRDQTQVSMSSALAGRFLTGSATEESLSELQPWTNAPFTLSVHPRPHLCCPGQDLILLSVFSSISDSAPSYQPQHPLWVLWDRERLCSFKHNVPPWGNISYNYPPSDSAWCTLTLTSQENAHKKWKGENSQQQGHDG